MNQIEHMSQTLRISTLKRAGCIWLLSLIKIVGWSMSSRMKADLVCDALKMAIWQRKPKRGLVVHSDRGSQYASHDYRKMLNLYGCVGSMSRKGNCWDNAVAESILVVLNKNKCNGGIIERDTRLNRIFLIIFRCFITIIAYIPILAI